MAYDDNQNEFPLPGNDSEESRRRSARHLPRYFRTETNKKFLSSTLDQLIQPGVAEKLNGYIGREVAKAYRADDSYIKDVSANRENYQFEPAAVIKDELGNVQFYKDYNDYINQIQNFNGNTKDHSLLNAQEYYAWNPNIDWDKIVNFREYYWLPNGPQTVGILGQSQEVESEYTITIADNADNYAYMFSPDGLTQNPNLKLYRGMTYRFNVNTPGLPFTIKTARNGNDEFLLETGISAQKVEEGVIELKLTTETPNILYYVADNDVNASGLIKVANLEDASFIDVETEILGKKNYTSSTGVKLSNGMKVEFQGTVIPEKYAEGQWYVEGVGDKIVLINEAQLTVASTFADTLPIQFDTNEFDQLPFDEAIGYPAEKDYIVINRASVDGNLWSRYNRWFHKSVIEASAAANDQETNVDQIQRAKRPIIEFSAGLKLATFGTKSKIDIDLVDDFTKDIFTTIEGAQGYNIDGVDLAEGMRILFTADTDILVKNRIYEVEFINFASGATTNRQIHLKEVTDTQPLTNETVLCKQGSTYAGSSFYFTGSKWAPAQEKTSTNQTPYFDVFDSNGNSYQDTTYYDASTFTGTTVFSYKQGSGSNDTELGFPLAYRTIENVGDITFNFNLLSDSFTYQQDNNIFTLETDVGYVRKYSDINTYVSETGWKKAQTLSNQPVIRQHVFDNTSTKFVIDTYDESGLIDDLWVRVYLNNVLQFEGVDYNFQVSVNNDKEIIFVNNLTIGDVVVVKTRTKSPKNENGYYEIPINLEKNPLNNDVQEFTLGEVNDHVASIVEELDEFVGNYPGASNLRDAGLISNLGKKFVKHSAPLNLSLYTLLDKDSNLIKSLRYSRREYGKFKRLFLQTANSLGFEGTTKIHVDKVLNEMVKDKTNKMPFYFSDMIPLGGAKKTSVEIDDADSQTFFALSEVFDINIPSRKAVQVYLNGQQLTYEKDYTFNSDGFVVLSVTKQVGDTLDIYEYESTNGSYCPPTPTKLGLYPKYEPIIYTDTLSGKTIIQGHDGSKIVGFDDFRDNLLLELELRIYNNLKVSYDTNFVDINEFINSEDRTLGFDKSMIDSAMLADFIQWTQLIDDDYTENPSFERTNSFTWHYGAMVSPQGNPLPGYWKAVYKKGFDTDRPHTHPWEMLGFTIKPSWWEEQYGPAPYTSNNLLMWEDLEKGIVREPGQKFRINKKYIRTDLTKHIPVDEDGNLMSPAESGYAKNFITTNIKDSFVFGDEGPVEAAWRNSSEYPFALMTAWLLTQPNKILSVGFDRINQVRNVAGELVYKPTNRHIKLTDLVFPNTAEDKEQIFTSGLVNYIAGYMAANITTPFTNFKNNIKNIKNQIGFKLAGFTEKEKFKLILDSRTPLNEGNVFVPEENYKIFLNTSTPVETINYSGVIVEKQSGGYIIRGYDREIPNFKYYKAIALDNDPVINVGGVSEEYVTWESNRIYVQGKNVEYQGSYYRVVEQHTSGSSFDTDKMRKLPSLPLVGGRDATFKRTFFQKSVSSLDYGTMLKTIQEVVDFLLGYEKYLTDKGFVFDSFDEDDEVVNDWKKSSKEFMFWTLQNWAEGGVITLSPSAKQIKFVSSYSMVDNIFDSFYGYNLYKADGKKLVEEFSSLSRENQNEFTLRSKNTADGIFAVKLPLVQKEHVVLLDNSTVFSDVIYDLEPGYRQERIRVLGYRTTEWDGSLNIPGFVYDEAKVVQWEQWTDYAIGDVVKYKEFYYTADAKVPGEEKFDSAKWVRLLDKPETQLLTNFEYKTNQFADFYDLDTDNFDVEQQKFAQHLIGYQNRNYLANIINDDVSQYKFYQGMIADKGTRNALTKLFDVLGSADKDSLEFYEEWAIKSGQYGAADGFEEVDFVLDEKQFRLTPQPIILADTITGQETDLIYRIRPFEVYEKPQNYDHKPFPTTYFAKGYTKDSGYVNLQDVAEIVNSYDDIVNLDYSNVKRDDFIWVGNKKLTWNVYKHVDTDWEVESITGGETEFTVTIDATPQNLAVGEIVGIFDLISTELEPEDSTYPSISQSKAAIGGFFKIKDVLLNKITLETSEPIEDVEKCKGKITRLESARHTTLSSANTYAQDYVSANDLIWVDDDDSGKWAVLRNNQPYELLETVSNVLGDDTEQEYGSSLSSNYNNTVLAVGAPNYEDGKVFVYRRGSSNSSWRLSQVIEANNDFCDSGQRFGESVAVSADGQYLIVGSPSASNVKSNFGGSFQLTLDYQINDIVQHNELLWRATVEIQGQEDNIIFNSFNSTTEIIEDLGIEQESEEKIDTIFTGNYPFKNNNTDHILVRAPIDMYEGSAIGDDVGLRWNYKTYANQALNDLDSRDIFNGTIPEVTGTFISGTKHEIQHKIDVILYVDAATSIPDVGDRVETIGAYGTVDYVYFDGARVSLYLKETNGIFSLEGSLFLESGDFVGEYERVSPVETTDTVNTLGGYWVFSTPAYNSGTTTADQGRGLVYYDVVPQSETDPNRYYYNILDYDNDVLSSENSLNSYVRVLSSQGTPGAYGNNNPILSDKYVVRAPKAFTDTLSPGDEFDMFVPQLARFSDGSFKNPADLNLTFGTFNRTQTVVDLWDGYINFDFTKFDSNGNPFEPKVGQIVRDVTTGARAEVSFYQRNSLNVTIFVKNVSGSWSQGNVYGDNAEIEFLPIAGDPDPVYQATRVMGQTQYRALGLDSEGIGKLIVLEGIAGDIPVPENDIILDMEYWFFKEGEVAGIPRQPSIPGPDNNDWAVVYNIPVTGSGVASGLTNEGMYSIYQVEGSINYNLISAYTIPDSESNLYLGNEIKMSRFNDLYKAFVHARGDNEYTGDDENYTSWGRIYFLNQGTDEFGGTWAWEFAKDKNFVGQFNDTVTYYEGNIVFYNGELYRALTNVVSSPFSTLDWSVIDQDERTEYVGFIPNETGQVLGEDSSQVISGTENLLKFASDFDVSDNGEVLVVANKNRTSALNQVLVYRSYNGNYLKTQTIEATSNTIGFGDSVSISADGMLIAIAAPFDDDKEADQGKVYIYTQQNGTFVKTQELSSRNNESAEQFGHVVKFDGNILAIGSKNADSFIETTFDDTLTTLDNNFTTFKNFDRDSGVVYIYERINTTLTYGQTLSYRDDAVDHFGRNVLATNNHVYVGLPRYYATEGKKGAIINYNKPSNVGVWEKYREPKETVDVNKIKSVSLYNKKEGELLQYLDYIDPIQGKIAGPAEQEISFKTYYDPATYTIGTDQVDVDKFDSWGESQVGRVWWDLTNAKFLNPYQSDVTFSTNNWNTLFEGNSIDVYEWVESTMLPSAWDELADTQEGLADGISGLSRYGDSVYVEKRVYDPISQGFNSRYFFWVKGKTIIPNVEWRNKSIKDVAALITDPAGQGYRFINFISENTFVLHNCDSLIEGTDTVLSVQYWIIDNQEINIHNQYQIVTEGLETSKPHPDIERKWFDSLIGYDELSRPVPSLEIPTKQKYGILNRPRQSWFVNRTEALKQVIERVNSVLLKNLVIDDKIITPLFQNDPQPSVSSNTYDTTVDVLADLDFVGVAKAERAELTPVVEDGQIIRVNISNPGRGYLTAPTVTVAGQGEDAEITTVINEVGQVTSAIIQNQGFNYNDSTILTVRRFTVLVNSDDTIQGKWALYERLSETRKWSRIESQAYDVSLFWDYADWYEDGYSTFTDIDFLIDESYELQRLDDSLGDIVKISNVGTGGWLLLEKIDEQQDVDYTVNYKTVGRQDGTIQFKDTLYDISQNFVGYDSISFDTKFFDTQPIVENRVVLTAIRDNLLIDELAIEYNKLFFASLRYVFAEQSYVDWAFKTSFVKAKHNVGELREDITFNNDNLPSYENYLEEVKPYKTKLREYLSSYEKVDNSSSVVTDFDLPPAYSNEFKKIIPQTVKVIDDVIVGTNDSTNTYPNKHWLDNVSYKVTSVNVADGGTGYLSPPVLSFDSESGSGAKAVAVLGTSGQITNVIVTNPGSGYLSAPTVVINGSQEDGSTEARLSAEIGGNAIRGMHTAIRFDRISGVFQITKLSEEETFVGSGSKYIFQLTWPMDLRNTTIEVNIDGNLSLSSEYSYYNVKNTSKGYDRYFGTIEFVTPPNPNTEIVVSYRKSINLLSAADRINLFYDPQTGQLGNDISQLMDGIDYGGVEVKSFEFSGTRGWDTDNWFAGEWDSYDNTYDDEIFELDGSTLALDLVAPLEDGIVYNVYKNNVRIDDPNFDTPSQTNPNALMPSITGDGVTQTVNLGDHDIPANDGDTFIVRKISSDGSFLPSPEEYDSIVQGGDFPYSTASGLNAEDINIDGDGFVTATTSKGPEETVPGQITDAVDIKVYERPTSGSSLIVSRNYVGDGTKTVFEIGTSPNTQSALFVKLDNSIKTTDDYEINYDNETIEFNTAPSAGTRVNLTTLGTSGNSILDIDTFIGDGSTNDFLTNVRWSDFINYYVTTNGEIAESIIIESDETYEVPNNAVIRFAEPPKEGAVVNFGIFEGAVQNYSQVTIDEFDADGSTLAFELSQSPFNTEPTNFYTVVKVNDTILNAGYNEIFEITDSREYQLKLYQVPPGTLNRGQIEVYINGEKQTYSRDWSFEGAGAFDPSVPSDEQVGSSIILANGLGKPGDELRVFILSDGEYRFGYFDDSTSYDYSSFVSTPGTLYLDSAYSEGDKITVYQFSNHNSQGIDRQNYDVVERVEITPQTENYYELRKISNGLIPLRFDAVDAQYVWVVKNGTLLNPSVDYIVTENKRYIRLEEELDENDVIETIHFANAVVQNKFGWRQFKDMLNKNNYHRIDGSKDYLLVNDVHWYDKTIEIDDATDLPTPISGKNPGVIFANGERIEYFQREGNILKQLRRGTLGTGVSEVIAAGTEVYNQSRDSIMPYKDEILTTIFDGDETTDTFELDFTPEYGVNEFEVFVAGKRLRKNSISSYQFEYTDSEGNIISSTDQDSPEGDITLEPEFSIDGSSLVLLEPPKANTKVIVVRKLGKLWTEPGTPISTAESDIARFLRSTTVDLPR